MFKSSKKKKRDKIVTSQFKSIAEDNIWGSQVETLKFSRYDHNSDIVYSKKMTLQQK